MDFLRIKARENDAREIIVAVRNIRLYDSMLGKTPGIPGIVAVLVCIYMAAIAGPIDAPIILINVLIPSDTPTSCFGVANMITFMAPTFVSDSPVDNIARFTEINNSVE